MRSGLLSLAAIAGALSVAVAWALSVNDPYWRLNGSEPIPALTQNGVTSPGIVGPNSDPLANVRRPSPALAVVNRVAATITEPVVMLNPMAGYPPIPTPQALVGPAIASAAGYIAPRIALNPGASVEIEQGVTVARAPLALPLPIAVDELDDDTVVEVIGMTSPNMALDAPTRPHFAATEISEDALSLNRPQRVEVQRRLALAGFDPHGFDGVFGQRTRTAIKDYQAARGYPRTGYLEPAVHADLNSNTEEAYHEMRKRAAARNAAKAAPVAEERDVASAEPGKCARDAGGLIIPRQSLKCDLAGLSEGFASSSRSDTDSESLTGEKDR
ncbi:MAG: peptidoglycan-binding protein [Paracoccaceae bacterium]|nr:peptidoglycan-binding protein [Paracoccaceae bacterium]